MPEVDWEDELNSGLFFVPEMLEFGESSQCQRELEAAEEYNELEAAIIELMMKPIEDTDVTSPHLGCFRMVKRPE